MPVEGERVHVVADGKAVLDLPWQAALELSRALYVAGKRAEEYAKRAGQVMDQAILLRAGAPIGVSDRADVQEEAAKEAAWNSDLRRFMPGGVKSEAQPGVPSVVDPGTVNGVRRVGVIGLTGVASEEAVGGLG